MAQFKPQETGPISKKKAIYDDVAACYDQHFQSPQDLAEDDIIFSMIRRRYHSAQRMRILDLGCGTGLALQHIAIPQARYLGIDISQKMIEQARLKFPYHFFVQGDMQHIMHGLSSNNFDLIISTYCSMSYLTDLEAGLREMYRLLAPGGHYFIMLAAPGYDQRPTYILRDKSAADAPMTLLAPKDLRAMIARVGLPPDAISYFHTTNLPKLRLSRLGWRIILQNAYRYYDQAHPERCYFQILQGRKPS